MTAAPIHLAGQRLMLDPAGGLVWPAQRILVVADLHLEKASHFAARGRHLPPWDTRATLDKLAMLIRRYAPRLVVALGDSFHDDAALERMMPADAARLSALLRGTEFAWISGNHDPSPTGLPGRSLAELRVGKITFRHQALARAVRGEGEISGHYHPRATVPARAGSVTRPCFVADPLRMILPAMGAFTGGLDVADPAVAGLFPRPARIFLLGAERLFSFTLAQARGFGSEVEVEVPAE